MPGLESDPYIENSLHLPCPSCGHHLRYSARLKKIACDYCGYEEEIDHSNDKVVEQSLAAVAARLKDFSPKQVGKKVFDCQNCGARVMLESDRPAANCSFCGSRNINLEAFDHQYIQPLGMIPFYFSRDEAILQFKKWIKRGWFFPNRLKKLARVENLHGIYLPFWTYDAHTESDWRGDAGFYYYETKQVVRNGKSKTIHVQKIRWRRRSGHLHHFFNDVLVVATGGLDQKSVNSIMPFHLKEVVNFDPRLLIGWEAEIYKIEVDEGYPIADRIMNDRIRQMCSAQLGGDTQRNLRVSSRKSGQTFKLLHLPLWICSYQYRNEIYHFLINGQTGKVQGEKPLSWIKIAILVLLIAAIIATVVLFAKES